MYYNYGSLKNQKNTLDGFRFFKIRFFLVFVIVLINLFLVFNNKYKRLDVINLGLIKKTSSLNLKLLKSNKYYKSKELCLKKYLQINNLISKYKVRLNEINYNNCKVIYFISSDQIEGFTEFKEVLTKRYSFDFKKNSTSEDSYDFLEIDL